MTYVLKNYLPPPRFERLVQYFMEPSASPEFQVAVMNFINVIVHSAEDMNFRVHLQHEFTLLGLDGFIEVRSSSSLVNDTTYPPPPMYMYIIR